MQQGSSHNMPDNSSNQQHPHLPQRPELSKDELRVLKECSTESFWYRCVPFSVALVGITQYSVIRGYIKPHPRHGALFKNMGAIFLGYILGKFSYQAECRKKILALPDSRLADAMRQRKGMPMMEEMSIPELPNTPLRREAPLKDEYRGIDFESDNRSQSPPQGLDDSQRPTVDFDSSYAKKEDTTQETTYSSYDDLRKQNREEYQKKMSGSSVSRSGPSQDSSNQRQWPQSPVGDQLPLGSSRPPPPSPPVRRPTAGKGSNKYGDVWDE